MTGKACEKASIPRRFGNELCTRLSCLVQYLDAENSPLKVAFYKNVEAEIGQNSTKNITRTLSRDFFLFVVFQAVCLVRSLSFRIVIELTKASNFA